MKTLPASIILEKNKLATGSAWIILIDINIGGGTILNYTTNNEIVTFGGLPYTPIPIEISATKENSRGEFPTITLSISNVTKVLLTYLETYNGLTGKEITIRVVNSAYLSADYTELEVIFIVLSTSVSSMWVSFQLGMPSPIRKRFPLERFMAVQCNWSDHFGGAECTYSGEASICDGSYRRCKELLNTVHFGGHPGIDVRGLRLV